MWDEYLLAFDLEANREYVRLLRANNLSRARLFAPDGDIRLKLRHEVKGGTYRASYFGRMVSNRPIMCPSSQDRIVQRAYLSVATKHLSNILVSPVSYGRKAEIFEGDRSVWSMLQRIARNRVGKVVLRMDIRQCFPSIDQAKLLVELERQGLGQLNTIVAGSMVPVKSFDSAVTEDQQELFYREGIGIPQGSLISPLSCQIMLLGFDNDIAGQIEHVYRYVDDIVALCNSQTEAESKLEWAKNRLDSDGFTIHPLGTGKKTEIYGVDKQFTVLGLDLRPDGSFDLGEEVINRLNRSISEVFQAKKDFVMAIEQVRSAMWCWYKWYERGLVPRERYRRIDDHLRSELVQFICKSFGVNRRNVSGTKARRALRIPVLSQEPEFIPTMKELGYSFDEEIEFIDQLMGSDFKLQLEPPPY